MKILEVKNLQKSFDKKPVLKDINFSLEKGEKIALTGSDGSGKTTLLRLLSGLLIPDNKNENPILIKGFSPYKNPSNVKKTIGYMPQNFGLYEDLTIEENLEFFFNLKKDKIEKSQKEELFNKLLNIAGLLRFKKRMAGALSGGMKQKLGLIRVLLNNPEVLFLDEPTVGVDPLSAKNLIEMVDIVSKENNQTVIWATSYPNEAENFDKVIFIQNGEIIYFGNVKKASKTMEGKVFYVDIKDNSRIFLEKIGKTKGVIRANLDGDKIRVIFDTKKSAENFPYKKEQATPVFEDFIWGNFKKREISLINYETKIPQNSTNIAIEATELVKKYKNFYAAKNINLKVEKGTVYGLLGPNGAGKSTIFKMLTGLIIPDFGNSKVMGIDIFKNPQEAKRNFGYMAQKFSLFPDLNVRENIEFFKGVFDINIDIEKILQSYDLKKYEKINANLLPLGYKQRLSFICALINHPPVLFLDEPTSGIDPLSRYEFWMRINNLVKQKTTVLVTTHFMDEAHFCDKIGLIYNGQILKEDTPNNFVQSVKNGKKTMENAFIQIIREAL